MTSYELVAHRTVASDRASSRTRVFALCAGILLLVALIALAASPSRTGANAALAATTFALVLYAWRRWLLAWQTLLGLIVLVILLIPIRRYTMGGGLPIVLEPYRLLIAIVAGAWLASLLVDPATRFKRSGLEVPIAIFAIAVLGSILLNIGRVADLGVGGEVVKGVSVFAGFFLVMYLITSTVSRGRSLDRLLMLLVGGGGVVAVLAMLEWRTGYNRFNDLEHYIPLLRLDPNAIAELPPDRAGRPRAFASAQHPIALSAALVLLLPLAFYLYRRTRHLIWLGVAAVLTMGALSTTSRTAALMLAVELVVFLWIKRKATVRLLPLLIPLIVILQIGMPGTLGTFRAILFPDGGLVAEQSVEIGTGTGRVADVAPTLEEWSRAPWLGQGFRTRITSPADPRSNARILDNEWLGMLLEVGAVGALSLLWIFVRMVRRLRRMAKTDESDHGWLLTALAAALAAFAVGMFTYDAFSFIQVSFIAFILLGVAAVAVRAGADESTRSAPATS